MAICKAELTEMLASSVGTSKARAKKCVDALFQIIEGELVKGEKVQIPGFGTFSTKERRGREAWNVATGEKMKVPPKRVPKFAAGAVLKRKVNA